MTDFFASTSEEIADWIETTLLVSQSGHFGRDRLDDLAAAEIGAPATKVSMGLSVMSKRLIVLGANYPFKVNDFAVVRNSTAPLAATYGTLLCLSPGSVARQSVRAADTTEMGNLLEEISESALANFWGPGGEAVNFGYPSKHGRPEAFDQAVEWLAERMGLRAGSGYRPPRRKDGGVDVILWRHFADRRSGFPIALAQCTIQAEAFTKTTDIDLRLWASWLAMDADPLSLLVIPGTIRTAGPDWSQLSTVVMMIDRIRLLDLLSRGHSLAPESTWLEATLSPLRELMRGAEL